MKRKWITWIIIGVAFVTQMLIMFPSGSRYCFEDRCGDYYWGVHEHDGIWHLSLANTAFRGLPLSMPTFAGEKLTGYNWLIDLPLFLLSKLNIPTTFTYFKLMPIIWFGLMIGAWKKFANKYAKNSEIYWRWLLYFLFFGSSLSFIFTLWHQGTLIGNSALIAMQPPMMLINLQFAYTLPILALVATLLHDKGGSVRREILLTLALFVAMGLKFYGGVIILAFIGINSLLTRNWKRIIYAIVTTAVAVILFYQPKTGVGSILTFNPLATVYPILEEKTLFYIPRLAAAKYAPEFYKKMIVALIAVIVFLVFNFGSRLIGLLSIKKMSRYELSILLTAVVATSANMLLVQRGEWWNTVQFLYYGFFLMGILAAKQLTKWSDSKNSWGGKIVMILGLIIVSAPNLVDTMRVFAQFPPASYVSDQEKEILTTLKDQPEGVVLALPLSVSEIKLPYSPAPLYLRYESAYVAAYSGKLTYFNDTVQARLVGIDYKEREQKVRNGDCSLLAAVGYIYVAGEPEQIVPWEKCNKKLTPIADNDAASLYRVE